MSAGVNAIEYHLAKPTNDISYLAPNFAKAVRESIAECNEVSALEAMVYETYRSNELQQAYYARGRDNPPPPAKTVTNARTNLYSWHGYGLAVDVITSDSNGTRGTSGSATWPRSSRGTVVSGAATGPVPTHRIFSGESVNRVPRTSLVN